MLEIRDGVAPADGEKTDVPVRGKQASQLARHEFSPMQEVPTQESLTALFKMWNLSKTILGIK